MLAGLTCPLLSLPGPSTSLLGALKRFNHQLQADMNENTDKTESRVEKLSIVRKGQGRYLVNGSDTPIDRVQYLTAAFGGNYVSSIPTFEVESIPAGTGAKIEEVNPDEGGALIWQISEVDWADGTEYRGAAKRTEQKKAPVDWETVEREKSEIGEPIPPRMLDDDEEGDLEVF